MEHSRFNIYFVALLLAVVAACTACKSQEERNKSREAATMRFFLETPKLPNARTVEAEVFRQSPFKVTVQEEPFLDEGDIERVIVVETQGSFALQVQFNPHGKLVLHSTTAGHRGKRIAILSTWSQNRWLAAPSIDRAYSDGIFAFAPDATREEAERIARGVNNVLAEFKKRTWVF